MRLNFVVRVLTAFPCVGLLLLMNGTLFATERRQFYHAGVCAAEGTTEVTG